LITQLTLKNFRGFDRHTVPLRPITILVGKNNAGKSTVVEALRLVSMVTNRYKNLIYHPLPKWLDRPRRERGVIPAVDNSEFSSDAVFHRLGDLIWQGKEVAQYEKLKSDAAKSGMEIPQFVKEVQAKTLK